MPEAVGREENGKRVLLNIGSLWCQVKSSISQRAKIAFKPQDSDKLALLRQVGIVGWTTLSEDGRCALSGHSLQALDISREARVQLLLT